MISYKLSACSHQHSVFSLQPSFFQYSLSSHQLSAHCKGQACGSAAARGVGCASPEHDSGLVHDPFLSFLGRKCIVLKRRCVHRHRDPDNPHLGGRKHIPPPLIRNEVQKVHLIVNFELQFLFLLWANCPCADSKRGRRSALCWQLTAGSSQPAAYFLSSTSTYSASITPSSFFAWPLPPADGPASALAPAPDAACEPAALYICSASLCDALVSASRARSRFDLSPDSSAFFASAMAFSTSPRSAPEILSPDSRSIFSIW